MLKRIVLTGIVAALSLAAVCHRGHDDAADFGTLQGVVTDSANGEPIVGVSVQFKGTRVGQMTDLIGVYRIQRLQPGIYTVMVTSVGYKTVEIPDVRLKSGAATTLNVKLTKAPPSTYDRNIHVN